VSLKQTSILTLIIGSCLIGCVGPEEVKISESWAVLEKSKPVSCDSIDFMVPRGSKVSRVRHFGDGSEGLLTAHALTTRGQRIFIHMPTTDLNVVGDVNPLAISYNDNETVVGVTKDLKNIVVVEQNHDATAVFLKDLYQQELMKTLRLVAPDFSSDFFIVENSDQFILGSYDDLLQLRHLSFSAGEILEKTKISLPVSYKHLLDNEKNQDYHSYFYMLNVGESGETPSLLAYGNEGQKKIELAIDGGNNIDGITMAVFADRLYLALVLYNHENVVRRLQFMTLSSNEFKVIDSKTIKLGNLNIEKVKINSVNQKIYFSGMLWLGGEKTLVSYPWDGAPDPIYNGRFDENTVLTQLLASENTLKAIVAGGKRNQKSYRLCALKL